MRKPKLYLITLISVCTLNICPAQQKDLFAIEASLPKLALFGSTVPVSIYNPDNDLDTTIEKIGNFPSKFISNISKRAESLQRQIEKRSKKYIKKLLNQETKLRNQILMVDSNGAKLFNSSEAEKQYIALFQKLRSDTTQVNPKNISGQYYPYIDSMQTTLLYLKDNQQLLDVKHIKPDEIQSAFKSLMILQSKLKDADYLNQFIQQRKEQIKNYVKQYINDLPASFLKSYQSYNKELFYYTEQIKQFRETLNDPDKMMRLTLSVLNKVPAFTDFVKINSLLASIFNLSGTYTPGAIGMGLSTRDQIMASMQSQVNQVGGPNATSMVQQNIQSAQGQIDQLRNKLSGLGSSGTADIDVPNFHPNDQKTKSFLKRLQVGADLQTVHSSYFFPTTTDFGVSLGYRLNDKNDIGLGASMKMGWGKDINHVNVTGQGVGLRSFLDINIKKSFYASGGFEYNYQQPFQLGNLPELRSWQQSGLLGITKKVSLKTKLLKSTKIQLLWDFLSYEQIPRTQPIKFRVGYSF
ncbi:MAG TPA: hypothetical protein VFU62_01815 [Hanamia sp.]|nr:hypothetical protein [Hanamia sp.]